MFPSLKSIATLALAADLVLGVPAWRRNEFPSISEWKSKNLESYFRFKARYRNLGCSDIKGTDFYDKCCNPLPKGENPPEECNATASCFDPAPGSYTPAPTTTENPAPVPENPAPAPTETYDGSENGGNDDGDDCEDDGDDDSDNDDDLPYCDEVGGGNEPTTPTSTQAPAPEQSTTPEPEPTTTPEPEPTTMEPEPTTTEPEPTTTEPEPTTTEPEPTTAAPDNGDNGNSGDYDVQTGGVATFYEQDGSEGACGGYHTDDEFIGAIDERRYGDDTVRSSECGRRIRVTNTDNGKSVDIVIVDDCPTCENGNSIDLSPSAFDQIAERVTGVVPISWYYLS